jgi:membrane protease YdiL (CAAX protease family)
MSGEKSRFGKLIERKDGLDFPFYNLLPAEIATWKWIVIILSCVVGFAVLSFIGWEDQGFELIPRVLFTAIPLITFIVLAKPHWRAIFQPLKWADLPTVVIFWLLTVGASAAVGLFASGGDLSHFQANSATDQLLAGGSLNVVFFYVGTFIQLFGEELVTILPFLAVLYWLHSKVRLSRKAAIVLAWVITAITFGAMHLPTYGWNIVQAIVLIGVARLALTLAFIRTKNILVSFGAHLLNDWVTFTFVLIATAVALN